jgi:hypothetical protein
MYHNATVEAIRQTLLNSFKMSNGMIYEIENLESAREFLAGAESEVVLSNPEGSTRYYGMRVIDCIFTRLQKEFPNKIKGVVVNAFDDYSAFVTAKELGYEDINYIG